MSACLVVASAGHIGISVHDDLLNQQAPVMLLESGDGIIFYKKVNTPSLHVCAYASFVVSCVVMCCCCVMVLCVSCVVVMCCCQHAQLMLPWPFRYQSVEFSWGEKKRGGETFCGSGFLS